MSWIRRQVEQIVVVFLSFSLLLTTTPAAPVSNAFSFGPPQHETRGSFVAGAENLRRTSPAALIGDELRRRSKLVASVDRSDLSTHAFASSLDEQRPILSKTAALHAPARGAFQKVLTAPRKQALTFIENKGQFDARARMQLKGNGRTAWLTNNGIVFDFVRSKTRGSDSASHEGQSITPQQNILGLDPKSALTAPRAEDLERLVISEDFRGAKSAPAIQAKNVQPGIYNYFLGNDPSKWRSDVRGYGEVTYKELWEGVDLKLYGRSFDLEQEFVVHPGGIQGRSAFLIAESRGWK